MNMFSIDSLAAPKQPHFSSAVPAVAAVHTSPNVCVSVRSSLLVSSVEAISNGVCFEICKYGNSMCMLTESREGRDASARKKVAPGDNVAGYI